MFLQKILSFHSWENVYQQFICLIEIWITWSQISQTSISNLKYIQKKIVHSIQGTYFVVLIWNIIPFENVVFRTLTAELLHLALFRTS